MCLHDCKWKRDNCSVTITNILKFLIKLMDSVVIEENMKNDNYHDVCQQIDNLLLDLFRLLDTLLEERNEFDTLMKHAYFDMAKARYSLGNSRVSSLQFSMKEISALKLVTPKEETNNSYSFMSYTITDAKNTKTDENNTVVNEYAIRKRVQNSANNEIDQLIQKTTKLEINTEDIPENESKTCNKLQDPLKWFGVLLPQSLKNCQKYFQQNIERIATIASIQNEIKVILEKIEHLQNEKKILKADLKI